MVPFLCLFFIYNWSMVFRLGPFYKKKVSLWNEMKRNKTYKYARSLRFLRNFLLYFFAHFCNVFASKSEFHFVSRTNKIFFVLNKWTLYRTKKGQENDQSRCGRYFVNSVYVDPNPIGFEYGSGTISVIAIFGHGSGFESGSKIFLKETKCVIKQTE